MQRQKGILGRVGRRQRMSSLCILRWHREKGYIEVEARQEVAVRGRSTPAVAKRKRIVQEEHGNRSTADGCGAAGRNR